MQVTKLAFEKRYSDDSGVEFGVRLERGEIEFEAVDKIAFPVSEIDWLIAALIRIKAETAALPMISPEATTNDGACDESGRFLLGDYFTHDRSGKRFVCRSVTRRDSGQPGIGELAIEVAPG